MSKESLKKHFPKLFQTNFKVTSDPDDTYNCVAWAMHDNTEWWEPHDQGYWPITDLDDSFEGYVKMFNAIGFIQCTSSELEEGYEKIAVFIGKDGGFSHVARQLDDKYWTSKCGQADDLSHSLESLEGENYGSVKVIMKREID